MDDFALVRDFVITLTAALGGGMLARYLRQPPILGFLVAGLVVGPSLFGLVDETSNIQLFAEFGVAFLMFNLGAGITLDQFRRGFGRASLMACAQVGIVIACAMTVSSWLGMSLATSLLIGVALAESSTAVVVKVAGARGDLSNPHARLAIAMSMGQDLMIIPIIAFLPVLTGDTGGGSASALTILRSVGFLVAAVIVARLMVPWVLERVAATSRELFLLAVVAAALAIGGAFQAVGLSFALGAFVAGLSLGGSHLSRDVQAEALPFQEVFIALFFVSIGVALDVRAVATSPWLAIGLIAAIVLGKGLVTAGVVKLFGYSGRTAMMAGAYLGQFGELSFVMAQMGLQLGLITTDIGAAMVVAALVTITVNPALVSLADRARLRASQLNIGVRGEPAPVAGLAGHVVLCGYTGMARRVARRLELENIPYVVVDQASGALVALRRARVPCLNGDAASPEVLRQANVATAMAVLVTISDPATVQAVVARARHMNPDVAIIAQADGAEREERLRLKGANEVVRADTAVGRLLEVTLMRHSNPETPPDRSTHDQADSDVEQPRANGRKPVSAG